MQRVLIVEDEVLVRVGLKNSVPWAEYDMQVIADVGNGQQGWEVYEAQHPEIVITDLKMPVLGGMDLIEKIREKDHDTKIIILTCVEDFSMARQAVSYHVTDYICKFSMTIPELEKVLRRLQEEGQTQIQASEGIMIHSNDKDAIREKVLKGQIFYNIYEPPVFQEYIRTLGLRISSKNMLIAIMGIEDHQKLSQLFNDKQGQLTKLSILNVLEDLMEDYPYSEIFQHQQFQYVFLIGLGEGGEMQTALQRVHQRFEKIQNTMYQYFNIHTTFGVSHVYSGYANMGQMFKEASQALEKKFFLGPNEIIEFGTAQDIAEKEFEMLRQFPKDVLHLNEGSTQKFEKRLENLSPNATSGIRELVCESLLWFVFSIGRNPEEFSELLISSTHKIQKSESAAELKDICQTFVRQIQKQMRATVFSSHEIERAVCYIRQNYTSPLQLGDVARYVGLNPNYFSTLFKKETGTNFVDYINELRIEKAKHLLTETSHHLIDIAQMVGFTEDTYFSRIFKRIVGRTPNEYRRQALEDWKCIKNEEKE